jgi:hypothetical protein
LSPEELNLLDKLREMYFSALSDMGGVEYLKRVGTADPKTFLANLTALLPKETNRKQENRTLTARVTLPAPTAQLSATEWMQKFGAQT